MESSPAPASYLWFFRGQFHPSFYAAHMRYVFALVVTLVCLGLASALAQPTNSFPLWADGAPGALGKEEKDIPTLTPYWPETSKTNGAAMVVCPGGGYGGLAGHEGKDYALWFNEQGIAAFVLKYRLGSAGYRHPVMLQDAARAVRTVRANAAAWKIDSQATHASFGRTWRMTLKCAGTYSSCSETSWPIRRRRPPQAMQPHACPFAS